jgi:hypothetical protein
VGEVEEAQREEKVEIVRAIYDAFKPTISKPA